MPLIPTQKEDIIETFDASNVFAFVPSTILYEH